MGATSGWRRCRRNAFAVIAALFLPAVCIASSIEWAEDLEPGPYAVGFAALEQFDLSRSLRTGVDYFGDPVPGPVERPIQIFVWYPAQPDPESHRMVYGEYNFAYPEDERLFDVLSELQDQEIALLHRLVGSDRGIVLDILSVEVAATRDAKPDTGVHPLVLYAPDAGHGMAESAVLCEYLASHGFVVAGTHSIGTASLRAELSTRDLSTQRQDMQFVLGRMLRDSRVDPGQVAVIGAGAGGASAILLAMQDSRVRAITVLEASSEAWSLMEHSPFYAPDRLRSTVLNVTAGVVNEDVGDWTTTCTYSDRYSARMDEPRSVGLTNYAWIASLAGDTTGEIRRATLATHNAACEYTRLLLSDRLADEVTATGDDPRNYAVTYMPAQEPPPSAGQFRSILELRGAAAAGEIFEQFDLALVRPPMASQRYLNNMGYRLLGTGRPDDALIVFRMCTEIYPNSANAWDSYGEGLETAGRVEEALAIYRRVLETIPTDSTASPELLEQLRGHAEEAIPRLECTTHQ